MSGVWVSIMVAMQVPNSRLKIFEQAIEQGKVLLMLDLPMSRAGKYVPSSPSATRKRPRVGKRPWCRLFRNSFLEPPCHEPLQDSLVAMHAGRGPLVLVLGAA
jgi:hypothetical protein